ncbi:hypothetical protein [Paraburkholderia xenovorans]|uniref:hypothetical protein n=1 Tax=Paraburkholderia xenovorans TaxID=36873 RepID=UPI0038BD4697
MGGLERLSSAMPFRSPAGIEAELTTLLEQYDNVRTRDDRRAVARNSHLRERVIITLMRLEPAKMCRPSVSESTFNSTWLDLK